jgi:hypothetical protein
MSNVQIAVIDQQPVQIAVIDDVNLQLALAAPAQTTGIAVAFPGVQGPVGVGFPAPGGTADQLLVKQSSVDYDAVWSSTLNVSGLAIEDGTY